MDDLTSPTSGPILSLDLGTTTGWAIQYPDVQRPFSGTQSFKPGRYEGGGMRYLRFHRFLDGLSSEHPFSRIVFEEIRRHQGVDAAHVYGGLLATLTAWCEAREVPYLGIPIGEWKKGIGLKGNANKEAVLEEVRRRGFSPTDDNEADVIGMLLHTIGPDSNRND